VSERGEGKGERRGERKQAKMYEIYCIETGMNNKTLHSKTSTSKGI